MQVILNLCSNAVKYTFKGSIKISIWTTKDNSKLCISVKDTGIGIVESELDKINTLFGLLERKLMRSETGIGMGLTISKRIIDAMKGSMKISSKFNEGTICKIKVPISNLDLDEVF